MPSPRTIEINGLTIFYREAGDPSRPKLLLLHGFPSSSHQYRHLMDALAGEYHVIAPDLPGFGFSSQPPRDSFTYSFDALTDVISAFTDRLQLTRYALYLFDYGAPVGLRLALRAPQRITAIITQNGNAYTEGLSPGFDPIRAYWASPTAENRNALRGLLASATTRYQYTEGAHDAALILPEDYTLDQALLERPGNDEIQLDLFLDYQSNVALYPAFQAYFRAHQPPMLIAWGAGDPFFTPAGAHAFLRDLPRAELHLLDAGHFALATRGGEIAALVRNFLARHAA